MRIEQLRDRVRDCIAASSDQPMSPKDIARTLRLRGKQIKTLGTVLDALVFSGDIARIRHDRYSLGERADLVTGTLSVARSGSGFVQGGKDRDVLVRTEDQGVALPGDRVTVRLNAESLAAGKGERQAGKIIRILERGRREVVGTLKSTGRFLCVVPIDPAYRQDIYVPDACGAKTGDRVLVRFGAWENRHVSPEGEIVEVLGPADNPSIDTLSVARHYGLRDEFPRPVLREAEVVSGLLEEPGPRTNLSERLIITVDPERARDFDDALSLEEDAHGRRVLGVHIADVSHFVRPGGDLDQEARERGNSVYFPDKVIPMLPEQLSNGVCSLQPGRPRLTFSAFLTVDAEGQVVGRRVEKTLILSSARLTYEQVMEILAGPPGREGGGVKPAVADLLRRLNDLAVQFRARRMAHHALDLDLPECEVVLTPDGRMTGIRRVESDASHQLIEECMVAANEAVALELAHRQAPLISRLHEPPADDKIEDLTVYLGGLGLKPGDLSRPSNLSAFLRSMKGQPLGDHVKTAVLRSQKRAQYSAEAAGHFGLAKKHYAHFTSPIRRYPDLVVHRQLAATLVHHPRDAGEEEAGRSVRPARRLPYGMEELIAIARHCSQTEERAEEGERAVLEIKKYRFLSDQLAAGKPEVYEAAVVTVTNFGMFVEVPSLQIQGLVHISTMSDGFVTYNRQSHSLRAGKLTFRPAQKIRVFVSGVDFDKRHIDFRLAQESGRAVRGADSLRDS